MMLFIILVYLLSACMLWCLSLYKKKGKFMFKRIYLRVLNVSNSIISVFVFYIKFNKIYYRKQIIH